uniref:Orf60 n=4 Tax=Enterobacterales TaxID=91347 RepID=A0A7S7BUF7_SERMA|nr:Orf60 [Serratia marcescens]
MGKRRSLRPSALFQRRFRGRNPSLEATAKLETITILNYHPRIFLTSNAKTMSATASAPHAALSRLYATHHAWLQGWLRRRLGCAFDADDVAQDTFMRLLKSDAAATLREPKDFLVTVAKRVMVDLFRRRTLERAYLEMLALIPEGYAPSPEQRQSLLESLQQIDAMLDGLGPKVKQAFLLSQLEGLGYADIAARLGVSVSSVKKYMAKATEHCLLFSLENDVYS